MGTISVLLANEPKAYRDTIAAALRLLRPLVNVFVTDPDGVEASVRQHAPQVVICSRLTRIIETQVPVWMVLYPDGAMGSVVYCGGAQIPVNGMDLKGIAHLIDQAGAISPIHPAL